MRLDRKQPPRPRDRRMVRRRRRRSQVQKRTQAQRIGRPPRDRPFRIQPLEVPEKQQPEVASRRQTRPSHRRVEPRAQSLHERVEASRAQNPVQSLVEGMPRVPRQIRRRHPHRLLRPVLTSRTHRHARQCRTCDRPRRSLDADFYHGLLSGQEKTTRPIIVRGEGRPAGGGKPNVQERTTRTRTDRQ